jgi:sulfate adenylyltransferase subunit 1
MASRLILKHTSRSVKAKIVAIADRVDVNTFEKQAAPSQLRMNDIAHVGLSLAQPVFIDAYAQNRETGAFILIDEATHQTVAAGMIESK